MQSRDMTVLFVHLGDTLPKYVRANIHYFKSTFPEQKVCVLVDSRKVAKEVRKLGTHFYLVENELEKFLSQLSVYLRHDLEFRSGFWLKTLARFFHIYGYMSQFKNTSVLQIETDVLCVPNFPFVKFRSLEGKMAFPLESPQLGIASVLYLSSYRMAKLLCEFAKDQIQSNPDTTDMKILGLIASRYPEKVAVLPTFSSINHLNSYYSELPGLQNMIDSSLIFEGFFDSVSIGQYLLGIDSRNNRGLRRDYVVNKEHLIDASRVKMQFYCDRVEVESGSSSSNLYSIHIHSKTLKAFRYPFNYSYYQQRVEESMYGERSHREIGTTIFLALNKLRRGLQR